MHHASLFCWTKQVSWLELLISPEHLRKKQFRNKNFMFVLIKVFYLQRKLISQIHAPCQAGLASLVHPGPSGWGLGLRSGTFSSCGESAACGDASAAG